MQLSAANPAFFALASGFSRLKRSLPNAAASFKGDTLFRRLLTLYGVAIAVMFVVGLAVILLWVWPYYEGMERREASHRQTAVLQALQSQRDRLQDLASTYGIWDDAYNYVSSRSRSFVDANMSPAALDQIDVNSALISDEAGNILFRGLGAQSANRSDLLAALEASVTRSPGLRLAPDEEAKTALVTIGSDVAIVSVRRIVRSDGSGPAHGAIWLARIVGPSMLAELEGMTGTPFRIQVGGAEAGAAGENVRAHSLLEDAEGRRSIDIAVIGAPEVLELGRATIGAFTLTASLLLIVLAAGFAVALTGAVVTPVTSLAHNVEARSRGTDSPLSIRRPPAEIAELAAAFDAAFQRSQLEAARQRQAATEALEARAAAEQANRAKSQFLANMSHELRTPLNAIIGYTEMLAEDASETGRESDFADLNRISNAAKGLLVHISSILDLSKLEAGHMPLSEREFSVSGMLKDTIDLTRPAVEKKGLTFKAPIDRELGFAFTHELKIHQCLVNLLSNAAKFTQAGEITLSARRSRSSRGDWLIFRVTDTGIGMSKLELERVFEPFVQADESITRQFGGTGLGLSITRELVARLGGRLSVRSTPGAGTRFVMCVPASLSASHAAPKRRAAAMAA